MQETKTIETKVQVKPKSNKTLLFIIGGCVLLLCCFVSMGLIGFFIWQSLNNSKTIDVTVTPTIQNTTETPTNITIPTLAEVKAKYLSTTSYHFSGSIYTNEALTRSFYGEFVAPDNDHYVTTEESDGFVTEEYTINGTHYLRDSDNPWSISDTAFNSTIQRSLLIGFFNDAPKTTQGQNGVDYWTYYFNDTANAEKTTLYVNKQTNNPAQQVSEYFDDAGNPVRREITFTLYNDTGIVLTPPTVSP